MKKILLIILFLFFKSSLLAQENECYGSGPTYYTTKILSIYEDMSINSAITFDIPKGEAVLVKESFFGDSGWWQICYKGNYGWVKKAFLSRKVQTVKTQPKVENYDIDEEVIDSTGYGIEVEFDPFLAKTNSSANFRTAPSKTYSHIIRKLPAGTQLYVFSKESKNDFYKVIDIKSAKVGWISKSLITQTGKVNINSNGTFQNTGSTGEYESSVRINNKSSAYITLIVGGQTFDLSPKSTDNKSISPGRKYYIATAPGVIPASGYQNFESYHGYSWEFWIETTRH